MIVLSRVVLDGDVLFNIEYSTHLFSDGKGPVCVTVGEDNTDPRIQYLTGKFVRFGGLPDNGQSKNHRTNELEAGVSVYEAAKVEDEYLPVLPNLQALDTYSGCMIERDAYIVSGRVVGAGSDGEPLLADVVKHEVFKAKTWTVTPLS